jgi:WD40 repeat protein
MTRSPQKSLSTAYRYVTAVGFSSDGDILGYTNNDKPITIEDSGVITDDKEGRGQIELWSIQTWTQVNRLISNDRLLTSISFSSDDTHLVSSNGLGRIAFWDYKKTSAAFVDASTDSVYQAVYSPDGKLVASTGFDGQIHVWDALKYPYSTVYSFMGDSRYTTSLSFSPDSNSLVANSKGDRKIKLWDVKNSKTVWVSGELREEVLVVSYSHTGGLVASAGADGTVRLWDAKTGELKQMFPGHGVACKSIAFSPDDRLLAGGYADGNIQIWEPAT